MLTGFSNIFKNINDVGKYVNALPWQHRAFQNFPVFFTFVPLLFVCIFAQSELNFLKLNVHERTFEPRYEKTGLRGFQPRPTQTGL